MIKNIKFFVSAVASICVIAGVVYVYPTVSQQETSVQGPQLAIDWFNPSTSPSHSVPARTELLAVASNTGHIQSRLVSPHETLEDIAYRHVAHPDSGLGELLAELDGASPQWVDLDLSGQTTDSFLFNFGSIVAVYQKPIGNSPPSPTPKSGRFVKEPFSSVGGRGSSSAVAGGAAGHDKAKAEQDETEIAEAEQDETEIAEAEQDETEIAEAEQDETEIAEAEQDETEIAEAEQDETEIAEAEQDETEIAKAEQDETEIAEAEQDETEIAEAEQDETEIAKAEQDETEIAKAEQDETEIAEAEQNETEVAKAEQDETEVAKAEQDETYYVGPNYASFIPETYENDKPGQVAAPVPEPSTWLLVGLGLIGVAWFRRGNVR